MEKQSKHASFACYTEAYTVKKNMRQSFLLERLQLGYDFMYH